MSIEYRHNTSSQLDILYHLQNVSSAFVDDLSERVNLSEYAKKLYTYAEREELWLGTELIGLVAYYINAETRKAFITNVSVDVRFQKRGIATELLDRAKLNSIKRNVDVIYLEVANDEHLIEFYAKRGFLFKEKKDSNYELYMYLKPLVAIRCTVYNHEPYIRECLDGFVMQKTNFKFVAIVHDDASTDGSAAIIREFEEKYPDIIKPIYETKNQYSKKDGSLQRIMNEAIGATGAKYVAMCEGDDYWTDPLKLQKQVDFMEANPEYSICFHKVNTLIQATGEIKEEFIVRDMPEKSTILDLAEGNYIHTPSVLYRKYPNILGTYQRLMPFLPGDYVMWMLLAEKGNIYKLNEPMAVYRYGGGTWESRSQIARYMLTITTLSKLCVIFDDPIKKSLLQQVKVMQENMLQIVCAKDQKIVNITNSRAYSLGSLLLKPIKKIKKWLSK